MLVHAQGQLPYSLQITTIAPAVFTLNVLSKYFTTLLFKEHTVEFREAQKRSTGTIVDVTFHIFSREGGSFWLLLYFISLFFFFNQSSIIFPNKFSKKERVCDSVSVYCITILEFGYNISGRMREE